jgi:hypothetical protein
MTSPWLLRIGRLALARHRFEALGGWRRLWWRFWWDVSAKPLPPLVVTRLTTRELLRPPQVLHWRPINHMFQAHYCGANERAPWTYLFETVTCPDCLAAAEPLVIKHLTTFR